MEEELDFNEEQAEDATEMPSYEDLVNVGYGEEVAHEIFEYYPEDAQQLYEVMEFSNQIETECEALIADNEAFLHGNSFFDSDICYSSSYEGDDSNVSDSQETTTSHQGKDISFGSLDCRSECKYHTGSTAKYSNYGFWD